MQLLSRFGTAWAFWVDALVYTKTILHESYPFTYNLPGIVATLALVMMNMVSRDDLASMGDMYDSDEGSEVGHPFYHQFALYYEAADAFHNVQEVAFKFVPKLAINLLNAVPHGPCAGSRQDLVVLVILCCVRGCCRKVRQHASLGLNCRCIGLLTKHTTCASYCLASNK